MTARQRRPEQGRSNDEQDTAIREAATFAIAPPVEPMLAKLIEELPTGGGWLYEPKWDGFRAIVFRGNSDVFIQSRDLRPLDRYFPELHEAFLRTLPDGCVVDGEIVIVTQDGLDFEALQLRLHPAASRVAKLAKEMPTAATCAPHRKRNGGVCWNGFSPAVSPRST